jgi:hypothetical protein
MNNTAASLAGASAISTGVAILDTLGLSQVDKTQYINVQSLKIGSHDALRADLGQSENDRGLAVGYFVAVTTTTTLDVTTVINSAGLSADAITAANKQAADLSLLMAQEIEPNLPKN